MKIRLCFKDRIGIVSDISRLIADNGLNIVLMEVVRKNDEAHVFVKAEGDDQFGDDNKLLYILENIQDIKEIELIDTMSLLTQLLRTRTGSERPPLQF